MTEPAPEPGDVDRYLHDWTILHDGGLVEIDPQDPASLAAFQDAAEEQQRFLRGEERDR